ncbi:hypothetical protein D1007_16020 [Hordeum vulgare]|uniref:Uncharacterized protein n=1 Tax=Hordeum vulgare subsp. vulgare TaxID=112509 RepID=A0A8I6WE66_HORVV|nr:hypothetical protein D1007_16020 [Hordeum vulgare]KAI5015604.1 hypothetical protein ZWY2020_056994 [Hordeum vulgare]
MDNGLYKRARATRHKTGIPFYPLSPAAAAPAAPVQAGNKGMPPAAAPWPLTPAPPPGVITVQVVAPGNSKYCDGPEGDADVDRRAALYISRVQERLRRER